MKLKLILLLALVPTIGGAFAAEVPPPITVAVLDFESPNTGPNIKNDLTIATSLITANLSTNRCFNLVERADLQKVLDEQALGKSGNINPDTAARIGQLTGAKVLVTGQFLLVSGAKDIYARKAVLVAKVVGAETGRVFIEKVAGVRSNELALVAELSDQITQTILRERTNLMTDTVVLRDLRISRFNRGLRGKSRPTVSLSITEQIPGAVSGSQTTESEFGLILQKAGFTVVDEKSDRKPYVLVTGNAVAAANEKAGGLCSCQATIELKAQERMTGKILTLDRQENTAVDIGEQTAAMEALESAADDLAERLLPLLAK